MLRTRAFALLLLLTAACGARPQPHRFGSPMLGMASVPPPPLPSGDGDDDEHRAPREVRAEPIRVAPAPRIREASAAAAAAVRTSARAGLPSPNVAPAPAPTLREPADLRALVGRRDAREPNAAALAWARDLGISLDDDIVAWAERSGRLHAATTPTLPGDLLVFDRVSSDDEADLVGIVVARDERGVTEFVYLGGGVIRRGFVDAKRPSVKRDAQRAIVNTFVRHGRRWPAKGSHYLAGEHLAYVIR